MILVLEILIGLFLALLLLGLMDIKTNNNEYENNRKQKEIRENQNTYGKLTEWLVRER